MLDFEGEGELRENSRFVLLRHLRKISQYLGKGLCLLTESVMLQQEPYIVLYDNKTYIRKRPMPPNQF